MGAHASAQPRQRGLRSSSNLLVLAVLYFVFCLTTALWALEVAQLIGLVDLLLHPDGLRTDALFDRFYAFVAGKTRITGILFECQVHASMHHGLLRF